MNKKNSLVDVPVLLMLFNRPETTRQVFAKIREARPSKLFIAANGPRPSVLNDIALCAEVRKTFDDIDWECDVQTNYRPTNIGMQPHWRLALDWFFEHVESGIILEDDCVADISFFGYCRELLEKYKDMERVMHISGSNFQFGTKRGDGSYYFSVYPHVWGWATWRRAWKKYDHSIFSFPEFRGSKVIDTIVTGLPEKNYWMKFFDELYRGEREGCDVKWLYTIWANGGLCVTPNTNMITNIGYGPQAEHTFFKDKTLDQPACDIGKIFHPTTNVFVQNKEADYLVFSTIFHKTFLQKVLYVITSKMIKLFR